MDPFEAMRERLADNLKLLSTPKFIRRHKENIEINAETFRKLNAKSFQLITYHLFNTMDTNECKKRFIGCFPVLDRKQEGEFRQITNKWLQEIAHKEKEWHFPRVVAIYFQNFSPEQTVCLLYLEFSNYVLHKEIQRLSATQDVKRLNTSAENDSICETIETFFNDYQTLRAQMKEQNQRWLLKMEYFVNTYHQLSKSLTDWTDRRNSLLSDVRQKYGLSDDTNVEHFISDASNERKTKIIALKTTLNSMNALADNNWSHYSKAFESQSNSLSDSVIDLNQLVLRSDSQKLDSFASVAQEMITRVELYQSLLENVSDNDLNDYSSVSSKLLNEIQSYRQQLNALRAHMRSLSDRSKHLCHKRRAELLLTPELIERRKWFAERVVDLKRIRFNFEVKSNETNAKELSPELANTQSKESRKSDESPVYRQRPSLIDYSFQVMDISTCHYIPPNGMVDDSPLFSPVDNKK